MTQKIGKLFPISTFMRYPHRNVSIWKSAILQRCDPIVHQVSRDTALRIAIAEGRIVLEDTPPK
jgi:hypothetical protein